MPSDALTGAPPISGTETGSPYLEDGGSMRLAPVTVNPPFSQNVVKRCMQFTNRFRFGWRLGAAQTSPLGRKG